MDFGCGHGIVPEWVCQPGSNYVSFAGQRFSLASMWTIKSSGNPCLPGESTRRKRSQRSRLLTKVRVLLRSEVLSRQYRSAQSGPRRPEVACQLMEPPLAAIVGVNKIQAVSARMLASRGPPPFLCQCFRGEWPSSWSYTGLEVGAGVASNRATEASAGGAVHWIAVRARFTAAEKPAIPSCLWLCDRPAA